MNCPNCNSNINPGENFCRICGTKVVSQQNPVNQNVVTNSNMNYQPQNNNQGVPNQQIQSNTNTPNPNMSNQQQSNIFIQPIPQQQPTNETVNVNQNDSLLNLMQPQSSKETPSMSTVTNQNMNNQFQNSNQNQGIYQPQTEPNYVQQQGNYQQQTYYQQPVIKIGINTEELIDAYIGNNVDQIKNRGFSFCTFFFAISYAIYRKMWLLAILWYIGSIIVSLFLPSFDSIISLVAKIILSVKFKDLYLKHVKEQVEKIKQENPNKTQEQLISICRKKGGTSLGAVILVELMIIALLFFLTFIENMSDETSSNNNDNDGLVGELNVEIPTNFEEIAHVSSSFGMYSLTDETDTCLLNITNNKYYNGKTLDEYVEDEIEYSESDILNISEYRIINGNKWYHAQIQRPETTDYYYVIQKNNEIYEVEFSIYLDNTQACSTAHSTIANSLNFD